MAASRSQRIGTIFSRVTSLVRGGVLQEENLPVWYDVYKTFPPKIEPLFGRKPSMKEIQDIFYEEDRIRAKLHKDIMLPAVNLRNKKATHTQMFLTLYDSLLQNGITDKEEAYQKALETYKTIFDQAKFVKSNSLSALQSQKSDTPSDTSSDKQSDKPSNKPSDNSTVKSEA